jgi:Probable cobalt transporter subunit (CbtA)
VDRGLAFTRIIVEPVIGARASHGLPATVGMACAVVVFGAAMGGLLAVAFAVSYGRLSSIRPGTLVLLLAADAFAALSVLPSVNYPPSPVSVGGDETTTRIGLYLFLVGLSLALIIGAVGVGRRLAARIGSWNATLVGSGAYVVGWASRSWVLGWASRPKRLGCGTLSTLTTSPLPTTRRANSWPMGRSRKRRDSGLR